MSQVFDESRVDEVEEFVHNITSDLVSEFVALETI